MKIDIIHTNDIHSHVDNFSKISHYIKKVRENGNSTFLFDAGDMITGEYQFKYLNGKIERAIANYLQYDLMCLGNHDFDLGLDFLKEHMSLNNTEYVLSNVIDQNALIGEYNKYQIIEKDGVKIGVISILLPYVETVLKSSGINELEFVVPEIYHSYVEELKSQNCDLIIALNHHGIDRDISLAETDLPIDIIIGAHSHTTLTKPLSINGTLIVQTGSYGENLGHLSLEYIDGEIKDVDYNLVDLNSYSGIDEIVELMISKQIKSIENVNEVFGSCAHLLEGTRELMIKESTNLGTLICDSYLDYTNELGMNADFALVNARGLRQSIKPGLITRRHLYNVMPFGMQLLVCELSGLQLKEILDVKIEFQTANLMIVSNNGKKKYYDQSRDCELDDEKIYRMVTIDYLYYHDLFPKFRETKLIEENIIGDIEVVGRYISKLGHDFSYEVKETIINE